MPDYPELGRIAQDGFAKLQQEIVEQGATDKEALTILLSIAQLKAHLAGVVVEQTQLPGEDTNLRLN